MANRGHMSDVSKESIASDSFQGITPDPAGLCFKIHSNFSAYSVCNITNRLSLAKVSNCFRWQLCVLGLAAQLAASALDLI